MQPKTLKKLGLSIAIICPISIVIAVLLNHLTPLSFFGVYFVYPFFIYTPLCAFILAALMFVISLFIENNKIFKRIVAVLLCAVILYLIICFGLVGASGTKSEILEKTKNINQSFKITNMSEINNAFEGADISYENEEKIAFGKALLYNYDYFFDVNTDEDVLSGSANIYYFEKVPFLNKKKLLNEINSTYFGYELKDHDMSADDIIYKQNGQMQYQYCYGENVISYGNLRRQAYFAILVEDEDRLIWGAISFGHNQEFDFDAEKAAAILISQFSRN